MQKLSKQGYYTEDSWKAWDAALADAKAVLKKEDASQAEVDQARQKLEKAAAGSGAAIWKFRKNRSKIS